MKTLSIIIPLGPSEAFPKRLCDQLREFLPDSEILLALGPDKRFEAEAPRHALSPWGRAQQQNAGAGAASGTYLWFLHADSVVTKAVAGAVDSFVRSNACALGYFQLAFAPVSSTTGSFDRLMKLNAWGANLRSRFLRMPFGDQGFLLRRDLWQALGGFDVSCAYGEDHLFVWTAHKCRVPLCRLPAELPTSARKYLNRGWGRATVGTVSATYRQAGREVMDLWQLASPLRQRSAALAVYVKTPTLSPVKTRLAQSTTRQAADRFYELALECLGELGAELKASAIAEPYWAVAEPDALDHPRWEKWPRVSQGTGTLGERLHCVYHHLLKRHRAVLLVGADCPQLGVAEIKNALALLKQHRFVMGPARDGGFYLFGGTGVIPKGAWTRVRYSESSTGEELEQVLAPFGKVARLAEKTDVDVAADLSVLQRELVDERGAVQSLSSGLQQILELAKEHGK